MFGTIGIQRNSSPHNLRTVVIPVGPSIAYVELTQGQWALIESDDAPLVDQNNWCASWSSKTNGFYAVRKATRDGVSTTVGMHTLFLKASDGRVVDHKNLNTLDNRRHGNLRFASRSQNGFNVAINARNVSGYKGVSFHSCRGKYRADISVDGRVKFLGYRDTALAAHELYCEAADELHGSFRRIA